MNVNLPALQLLDDAIDGAAALDRMELTCCTLEGLNPLVDSNILVEDIFTNKSLSFVNYFDSSQFNSTDGLDLDVRRNR